MMSLILFRIAFFCLVPIGIFVLVKTIQLLKHVFSGDILVEIPFTQKETVFKITKPGVYAIWQKGQLFQRTPIDKFKLELTIEPSGEEVALPKSFFSPHLNSMDTARMEMNRFSADSNTYKLRITEGTSVTLFEKQFSKLFPTKNLDYAKYFIQVRESRPVYYIIAAIPLFTLSAFCMIGGLVAGFMTPNILTNLGIPFGN